MTKPMKKRKKVLVGWIAKKWDIYYSKKDYDIPHFCLSHPIVKNKIYNFGLIKVRITIEEV